MNVLKFKKNNILEVTIKFLNGNNLSWIMHDIAMTWLIHLRECDKATLYS